MPHIIRKDQPIPRPPELVTIPTEKSTREDVLRALHAACEYLKHHGWTGVAKWHVDRWLDHANDNGYRPL